MKKKISAIFVAALTLTIVLAGCSASTQKYEKLSGKFDEKTVESTAESVVSLASSGDYQKISDSMVGEDLKKDLSADVLKNAVSPVLSKAGGFVSISSDTVTGLADSKAKKEYAIAVVVAKYKNQDVQYTITFGTDMKIEGFYIK